MKVIILAAGTSRRLDPLTKTIPKGLLHVGPEQSILEHQLECLWECSLHDIVLVVGHGYEHIQKRLGNAVSYIFNPIYYRTNSLYSFYLAREETKDGFILINSDVLFHKDILKQLLTYPHADALSVDFGAKLNHEEMKVKVEGSRIVRISKDISPEESRGESLGLLKFGKEGARILSEQVGALVEKGIVNVWVPYAIDQLAPHHAFHAVSTQGLPWIEIDTPEDLERARKTIYPLICNIR